MPERNGPLIVFYSGVNCFCSLRDILKKCDGICAGGEDDEMMSSVSMASRSFLRTDSIVNSLRKRRVMNDIDMSMGKADPDEVAKLICKALMLGKVSRANYISFKTMSPYLFSPTHLFLQIFGVKFQNKIWSECYSYISKYPEILFDGEGRGFLEKGSLHVSRFSTIIQDPYSSQDQQQDLNLSFLAGWVCVGPTSTVQALL